MEISTDIIEIKEKLILIEAEQANFVDRFDLLSKSIETLDKKSRKPIQWGVLAAWTSVLLILLSAVGTITFSPLKESVQNLEESQELQQRAMTKHIANMGHPDSVIQAVNEDRKAIERIEQKLERIFSWYTTHDVTISRLNAIQGEKINNLEKQIAKLSDLFESVLIKPHNTR